MSELKKVYLYGTLADGLPEGPHEIAASSLADVCGYFDANYNRIFSKKLREIGNVGVYLGDLDEERALESEQVSWTLGNVDEVHIMPEVEGRKRGGIFKAIFGALLIGAGLFMGFAAPVALGGLKLGITWGSVALMGVGMVLSAFAMPPETNVNDEEERRESSMYTGPLNTTEQGVAVPLVYGHKVRVGGIIIHTGLDIEDLADSQKNQDPVVTVVNL